MSRQLAAVSNGVSAATRPSGWKAAPSPFSTTTRAASRIGSWQGCRCRLEDIVQAQSNRRVIIGTICCVAWSAGIMAGCELDNTGTPQVIPGPSVPSPVPLHAPYVWDTPEELRVWTDNAVSRGSFTIESDDSNGAIAIQFAGSSGGPLLLRGPDIDPPAKAIRAFRIRYQWLTE